MQIKYFLKNGLGAILLLLIIFTKSYSQEKVTLSGYVKDARNGEDMIGVSIFINDLKIGVQTNVYGFYSITAPTGKYKVSVSYIGYKTQTLSLDFDKNKNVDVELKEDERVLDEIIVSTKREDDNVKTTEMSVNKVEMKTIKKMPALLGEVDVIRSIQFLPGVSSVGEGAHLVLMFVVVLLIKICFTR